MVEAALKKAAQSSLAPFPAHDHTTERCGVGDKKENICKPVYCGANVLLFINNLIVGLVLKYSLYLAKVCYD